MSLWPYARGMIMPTNPHTAEIVRDLSGRESRRLVELLATCAAGEPVAIHSRGCPSDFGAGMMLGAVCECRPIILRAGAEA